MNNNNKLQIRSALSEVDTECMFITIKMTAVDLAPTE